MNLCTKALLFFSLIGIQSFYLLCVINGKTITPENQRGNVTIMSVEDPFAQADTYIEHKRDILTDLDDLITNLQDLEAKRILTQEQSKKLTDLQKSRKDLEAAITDYETAYADYTSAQDTLQKSTTIAEQQIAAEALRGAIKTGTDAKTQLDPLADDLQTTITQTAKELGVPEHSNHEAPSDDTPEPSDEPSSDEPEEIDDERFEKIVESLIDYLKNLLLPSWLHHVYFSLPELIDNILELLLSLIEGSNGELTFSQLYYKEPHDETTDSSLDDVLPLSQALTYFLELQHYKSYFTTMMIDARADGNLDDNERTQIKAVGDILNKILYNIEQLDSTILRDIAYLEQAPEQPFFINALVQLLNQNPNFPKITLTPLLLPPTSATSDTLSKKELLYAMQTMQKIEGNFLIRILQHLLNPDKPFDEQEFSTLAQVIVTLENEIENQNPRIFADLKNIRDLSVDAAINLNVQAQQDQALLADLSALESFIITHSRSPQPQS